MKRTILDDARDVLSGGPTTPAALDLDGITAAVRSLRSVTVDPWAVEERRPECIRTYVPSVAGHHTILTAYGPDDVCLPIALGVVTLVNAAPALLDAIRARDATTATQEERIAKLEVERMALCNLLEEAHEGLSRSGMDDTAARILDAADKLLSDDGPRKALDLAPRRETKGRAALTPKEPTRAD